MDHNQSLRTMAAERYLLNELNAEDREAFEVHFFSCDECAHDLKAAAAFLQEAKAQLPEFAATSPAASQPSRGCLSEIDQPAADRARQVQCAAEAPPSVSRVLLFALCQERSPPWNPPFIASTLN